MTAADDLRTALDGEAPAAGLPKPPRKGSALSCAAPTAGATTDVLLAWLTDQLRLPAHAAKVQRWAKHAESPVTVSLTDGRRLRFDQASDLFNPTRLVQTVVFQLGADAAQLPPFSKADAQDVATVMVRACEAIEDVDERDGARSWQESFLRVVEAVHGGDYADAGARWAGLRELVSVPNFDPRDHRLAFEDARHRAPMLVWADGTAYVRVTDVERFVRGVLSQPLSSAQIVARMKEVGWEHRRAEARRPGARDDRGPDGRVRISVLVVPVSADA